MKRIWDVVIAGAGPAGLSAALVLGRACRRILLCDTGTPRSWASNEMHAYLSRDCISPARFRDISHREVLKYPGVKFAPVEVVAARRDGAHFHVELAKRQPVQARKLLIATGLFDIVPRIPGIEELFGRTVFQCPYCDGWEMRGKRIAVYGRRQRGLQMARAMTAWARDIVLLTDGRGGYSSGERRQLERNGIRVNEERIARLDGSRGKLAAVTFRNGERWPATPCSSIHPRATSRNWRNHSGANSAAMAACCVATTRPPACPVCSSRGTSFATCSCPSWPLPRALVRLSASIAP